MLDHSESPPPLHHSPAPSEQSRFPSRDSTPLTPIGPGPQPGKRPEKDREFLPWFKKPIDVGRTTTRLCLDTTHLEPDFDDHSFPLFGASPPDRGMATTATPINIRPSSTSPLVPHSSNMAPAWQRQSSRDTQVPAAVDLDGMDHSHLVDVESSADLSRGAHGAKPISMRGVFGEKNRRESIAQSLGTGMSWGGVSVGSWIRDDIMMEGTSPFAFQSPSYHSSSYLPKLEANFMKDFSCCGLTLPTLHDLLQHYEEAHAQKPNEANQMIGAQQQTLPDARAAIATNTAAAVQQQAEQQRMQEQQNGPSRPIAPAQTIQHPTHQFQHRPSAFSSTLQTIPDMDTVEDMEMDDIDANEEQTPSPSMYTQHTARPSPQMQFATTAQPQVPQLNTNMMQGHQGYRNSTPGTPIAPGRPGAAFQNNQNGINTPTLMNNPMQQQFQDLHNQYRATPDSSAPGTPGELDEGLVGGMDGMTMQNGQLFQNHQNGLAGLGAFGFGNNDMLDLCIDEPAKRLFTPGGGFNPQSSQSQYSQNRLGSGQYGPNSEIAKRIREQQMLAGLPDTTTGMMPHEEPKPFRCPVIGCEKAYKNQNGLKYHKSHGHNNQQLHENGDGTFSIVNPDTHAPYPGTQGMEKEKPYKCDVCQKRYKNLNGLKYHKTHSPPCNPDLQQNRTLSAGMGGMMPGQMPGMNLGAGLSGGLLN